MAQHDAECADRRGFAIRRVVEWSPTPDEVAAQPSLADELERPMMALAVAQK